MRSSRSSRCTPAATPGRADRGDPPGVGRRAGARPRVAAGWVRDEGDAPLGEAGGPGGRRSERPQGARGGGRHQRNRPATRARAVGTVRKPDGDDDRRLEESCSRASRRSTSTTSRCSSGGSASSATWWGSCRVAPSSRWWARQGAGSLPRRAPVSCPRSPCGAPPAATARLLRRPFRPAPIPCAPSTGPGGRVPGDRRQARSRRSRSGRSAAVRDDGRVAVVIDQSRRSSPMRDEEERDAFVRAVVEAADDPRGVAIVVLCLRAHYYGRCSGHRAARRADGVEPRARRPDDSRRSTVVIEVSGAARRPLGRIHATSTPSSARSSTSRAPPPCRPPCSSSGGRVGT